MIFASVVIAVHKWCAAYKKGGVTTASPAPASQRDRSADDLFVVFDDENAESMWHSGGLNRKAAAVSQSLPTQSAAAATPIEVSAASAEPASISADIGAEQQLRPGAPADAVTAGALQAQAVETASIPGLGDLGDDLVLGNVTGMAAAEQGSSAAADANTASPDLAATAFPGVNAPIPDGADPARWGPVVNSTPNGLHGDRSQQAAESDWPAAGSRGGKRSYDAVNGLHAGGTPQQTYSGSGHGTGGDPQRQWYRYHVRNQDNLPAPQSPALPSPAPAQPPLFATKMATMPSGQLHPQAYDGFAVASAGPLAYQHQNGYAAVQSGPPLPPPDAIFQHGMPAAYPQHVQHYQPSYPQPPSSYPQPSTPGLAPFGAAATGSWQQTAQWPAPQTHRMYRTRQ